MNTLRAYGELKGRVFSAKIPDELTIHQIMEQSYRKDVEILKMDIEGSEFTALEPFLKEHYVCQILIEIHGWPPKHLELLQKIAR
uniref:Methyltransf_21 domain-containing protein n=1 Tax=Caenorhabditis japonica TaxID=281687 RepID=A0A8R1IFY1_CAEJA